MSGALQRSPSGDRPTVAEFSALTVLLLALVGILVASRAGFEPAVTLGQDTFGWRFVATAVYSAIALTVLGGVYAAYASFGSRTVPVAAPIELVRGGLVAAMLVVLGTYAAVVYSQPPLPDTSLASPWIYYGGMALLAVGYARSQDRTIRTAVPTGDDLRSVGIAMGVAVVAVVIGTEVPTWLDGNSPFAVWGLGVLSAVSPWRLVVSAVLPAVLAAVGMGLLFYGVVQESLRSHLGAAAAAGSVTLLVFLYDWSLVSVLSAADGIVAVVAVLVAIPLVLAVAFGYGFLWIRFDPASRFEGRKPVTAVAVAIGVLTLVAGAVGVATGGVLLVFSVLTYAVPVGVAAVVYERTETVVSPILVLATYGLAIELVAFDFVVVSL